MRKSLMKKEEIEHLERLRHQLGAMNDLFDILESDTRQGHIDSRLLVFLYREFNSLAEVYFNADDESNVDKEESLKDFIVYCDKFMSHHVFVSNEKMAENMVAMCHFTQLYSGLVQVLGFAYVGDIISYFSKYWQTIWIGLRRPSSRVVRITLLESLLTLVAEETHDLSSEELDDYVAVPVEWRYQMLGFFGADDPRFDHDDLFESMLRAIKKESDIKEVRDDINRAIIANGGREALIEKKAMVKS